MFPLLTKYLLQFKSVVIPHVGKIELTRHPAELDFAQRLLQAPAYSVQVLESDNVTEHQLAYVAQALGEDRSAAQLRLAEFGEALINKLGEEEVIWNGIGILALADNKLILHTEVIGSAGWNAVDIHKIMREEEPHPVLMGDKEMHSHEAKELLGTDEVVIEPTTNKKTMWIGWVAAAVAFLFIGYYLYTHHFLPAASGNTIPIIPVPQPATYH